MKYASWLTPRTRAQLLALRDELARDLVTLVRVGGRHGERLDVEEWLPAGARLQAKAGAPPAATSRTPVHPLR